MLNDSPTAMTDQQRQAFIAFMDGLYLAQAIQNLQPDTDDWFECYGDQLTASEI